MIIYQAMLLHICQIRNNQHKEHYKRRIRDEGGPTATGHCSTNPGYGFDGTEYQWAWILFRVHQNIGLVVT